MKNKGKRILHGKHSSLKVAVAAYTWLNQEPFRLRGKRCPRKNMLKPESWC